MNKKLNGNQELLVNDKDIVESLMEKVTDETSTRKINGVVIGKLRLLDPSGNAFVDFDLNPEDKPVPAISTVTLTKKNIGEDVALLFQNGNLGHPLIIGLLITNKKDDILSLKKSPDEIGSEPVEIFVDKKRITFNAEKEISFKCGKASITLTSAGKILIRGKYLLSRSSGINRIKGGSVQIN